MYLPWLNHGKIESVSKFLNLCHDVEQYFIDLFWEHQDFSAKLADLPTVHRATLRFGITTRLSQALAKQAKETLRVQQKKVGSKPELTKHAITLYSHFVRIETFKGSFDLAVKLVGSGAPKIILPCKRTKHLNELLARGYSYTKSIRLGKTKSGTIFIDFFLEMPRPPKRLEGKVVGMDSNYRAGLVFSDGQVIGEHLYNVIQSFDRRQKHTYDEVRSLCGQTIKKLDLSGIKMIALEQLRYVKSNTRGKFPRSHNRRLSHWVYPYTAQLLERKCEELGIHVVFKSPAYTSQFCRLCSRWDKRNRKGSEFTCIHCGHHEDADYNASKNLELLGLAGVYGLRSLKNSSYYFSVPVDLE